MEKVLQFIWRQRKKKDRIRKTMLLIAINQSKIKIHWKNSNSIHLKSKVFACKYYIKSSATHWPPILAESRGYEEYNGDTLSEIGGGCFFVWTWEVDDWGLIDIESICD